MIGDVAGHGVEAVAAMTRLRTLVRMLASSGASPAGVLRWLNDTMHDAPVGAGAPDVGLATLVHGRLDPVSGALSYSSAGHLPLIALSARDAGQAGAALPVPVVGGPPIGVVADLVYVEGRLVLEPGSRLIGFTDGLIERRGSDLDSSLLALLTGLSRLTPQVVTDVEALADAVLELAPRDAANDDVALLVLGHDPDGAEQRPPRPEPADRSTVLILREEQVYMHGRLRRGGDRDRRRR